MLCFFDGSWADFASADQLLDGQGLDGWILPLSGLDRLESLIHGPPQHPLAFCVEPTLALTPELVDRVCACVALLVHRELYVVSDGQPLLVLKGWDSVQARDLQPLQGLVDALMQAIGLQPILLAADGGWVAQGLGAGLVLEPPCHGSYLIREQGLNFADFRGCLYHSYYHPDALVALPVDGVAGQAQPPRPVRRITPPPTVPDRLVQFDSLPVHHTPRHYLLLLEQHAALSRVCRDQSISERLVVVDSWLRHVGMQVQRSASLQALDSDLNADRTATLHYSFCPKLVGDPDPERVALIIHAYHVDELLRIVNLYEMKQLKSRVDLFISVPPGLSRPITGYLAANGWCASVQEIRNRGRDVLPFVCQQLPWVIDRGYSLFAKIHTKKSTHLQHGSDWGQWLQREIVAALADGAVVEQLRLDNSIGLMAPAGSIVPATLHLADNVRWMTYLAALLGHDPATILTSSFVAGTMMIGRIAALRRLLDLGLTVESFEVESGQLDGTLAHAIERMLGILCTLGGFEIVAFEPSRELRMNLGYKR